MTCLRNVARLDYPLDRLEVIVVCDGGPTPHLPLLAEAAHPAPLRLLRQTAAGPATARNAGSEAARGDLLAFIDDDCRPGRRWLRGLVERLSAEPTLLVGGPAINELKDNPYAAASQLLVDLLYAFYNRDPDDAGFVASNNLACWADAFHRMGGFDSRFERAAAEDRELCDRWRQRGGWIAFVPDAVVWHAHRMGFSGFVRQHFGYGMGASRFHTIRAARGSGSISEAIRFHRDGDVWRRALGDGRLRRRAGLLFLLATSQVSSAAGFLWHRVSGRDELAAISKADRVP